MWQTMEASGNYSMPDMDLLRYSMPPATNNDYESWHRAVLNAQTQIEHQTNRLENLELLKSFGANAWRHHLVYLESEKKALDKEFDQMRKEREELNKQRKTDQGSAGNKLTALRDRFYALLTKNAEIIAACEQLEAENQRAKGALSVEQLQQITAQLNLYSTQNGAQNNL
jgi:pre-mRNA-splicing factor SPF27